MSLTAVDDGADCLSDATDLICSVGDVRTECLDPAAAAPLSPNFCFAAGIVDFALLSSANAPARILRCSDASTASFPPFDVVAGVYRPRVKVTGTMPAGTRCEAPVGPFCRVVAGTSTLVGAGTRSVVPILLPQDPCDLFAFPDGGCEADCSNTLDDDGDGRADCEDPACAVAAACAPATGTRDAGVTPAADAAPAEGPRDSGITVRGETPDVSAAASTDHDH